MKGVFSTLVSEHHVIPRTSLRSPPALQPAEEIVEGEEGELDADVGAAFTASVTKGDASLV